MNFDNFYPAISKKIRLKIPKNVSSWFWHFGKTGVVSKENAKELLDITDPDNVIWVGMFDAEPMNEASIEEVIKLDIVDGPVTKDKNNVKFIIATSDFGHGHIDSILDNWTDLVPSTKRLGDTIKPDIWYYFFHGFIALDWFREYRFYDEETLLTNRSFTYNFMTMNRLVSESRNYRLVLSAYLSMRGVLDKGLVSFSKYEGDNGKFLLPPHIENLVVEHCSNSRRFDLQGDFIPNDSMHINMDTCLSSFLHIVTETCFYQKFNHLTEKVFKPIIMMQPFILVSTKGSLSYLKRYGFKTFDSWIDESYDEISNPFKRLEAIADEIEKIANMSSSDIETMYYEMLPILEHNRRHFYGNFYEIINKEMWNNFDAIIK